MNKNDIQLLHKYDRWANHSVLRAASALSTEQFMRDRGGNFRSVRDTLIHIFGGVNGFGLPYWNLPSLSFAVGPSFGQNYLVSFKTGRLRNCAQ